MNNCIILQNSPKLQARGELSNDREKSGECTDRCACQRGKRSRRFDTGTFGGVNRYTAQYLSGVERGAVGLSVPVLQRLCSVLLVSSDYILTGNTETSDVLGVTARLSKLPAEHIKNVENILDRYMEGIAISRQIQIHGEKKTADSVKDSQAEDCP